jgi:hypothetical protein
MFKRIATQFLIEGPDQSAADKSPSARTTEPSTTTPSDFTDDSAAFPASPTSAVGSLLSPQSPHSAVSRPYEGEVFVDADAVGPSGKKSFFSWWSCGCVDAAHAPA